MEGNVGTSGTRNGSELTDAIDLHRAWRAVRRRWPLIVLCIICGAGAAYGISQLQTKKYSATAAVLFNNSQLGGASSSAASGTAASVQQSATNLTLLTTQSGVAQRTARIIGHGVTAGQVAGSISVAAKGGSSIADVTATTTNPTLAADIANTFAQEFISVRTAQATNQAQGILNQLTKQLKTLTPAQRLSASVQALVNQAQSLPVAGALQAASVELVRYATPPGAASSPHPRRAALLGGVIGLLLALLLILGLERLDRRVRSLDDLERASGLPLLAVIPHVDEKALASEVEAQSNGHQAARVRSVAALEAFRMLRAHLRYFNIDRDVRTLLIASASPGEGKTLISCHLAEAAATMGSRVLLLEADLRRGAVAKTLGLAPRAGLAEVLAGSCPPEDALAPVELMTRGGGESDGRLDVIVAGGHPPNPAQLLESQRAATLLTGARERYDLVVIDSAPLSVVSDIIPLLRHVDGVILVGRVGHSTTDALRRMREHLLKLNAPVLGVVANDLSSQRGYGYGYGYGDGYAYYRTTVEASSNGAEHSPTETLTVDDAERSAAE